MINFNGFQQFKFEHKTYLKQHNTKYGRKNQMMNERNRKNNIKINMYDIIGSTYKQKRHKMESHVHNSDIAVLLNKFKIQIPYLYMK